MKNPSTAVHQIIHSMTASEKRYFQQYAGRQAAGEPQQYLTLFQILCQQPVYDEAAAGRQMPGQPGKGHFAVVKRHLYQHLLDALSQYHRRNNPSERLKGKLHAAQILRDKGLFTLMEQELRTARKLLKQYQLNRHWPELLELERSLVEKGLSQISNPALVEQWRTDWEQGLEALQEEGRFAFFSLHIAHRHYQKIQLPGPEASIKLKELTESEAFMAGRNSPHLRSRMDYFRALSTYHFMQRQPQAALQANAELIQLFEANGFLIELYPQRYLAALHNFLIDLFQMRQWGMLDEGLQKLKALPSHPAFRKLRGVREKAFEQRATLELNMHLAKGAYSAAMAAIPEIEAGLRQYGRRIAPHNRQTLWYLMAYICFLESAPDRGLGLLNELLQARQKGVLEELNRFANLLQLLLHYELGNYELLPYLIASVRRQHQGLQPDYLSEQLLMECLRRLLNAADKERRREALNKLSEEIENQGLKKTEVRFFEYLDLKKWLKKRGA